MIMINKKLNDKQEDVKDVDYKIKWFNCSFIVYRFLLS